MVIKILNHRGLLSVSRPAFTLIELIAVMVILAIASMVALPMMSSAGSVQLRAAGDKLMADLEYAKSMAVSTGQTHKVVFNTVAETYEIQDASGVVINHPVNKGFTYVVDFANSGQFNRVDISSVDFDCTSEIRFDYLGSPSNGSGGPLNSGSIDLQIGSTTRTILVEPVTGMISSN
jgi:prepilin-type N-terminal cleavage/methylation domain-containing protein